jgi:RimJ/RimL family protein N-acetyltransferase
MFHIETERLVIRPWEPQDREGFRALAQNPIVMRYINEGVPLTEEQIDAALARQARQYEELGYCMGALIEKEGERLVGTVGLQPLGTTGDLEIGWWLDPAVWGRGYATEAASAAVRYIFEVLGRDRVMAIIDPPNDSSKRVAERLGMRLVGRTTGKALGHRLPEIVVDLYRLDRTN